MVSITATTPAERALLEGLARSEPASVRAIYDLVLPSVMYDVRQNSGTEADARDIFQDAMMALYRRLTEDELVLTVTLKTYLRAIGRNLWLKRLRRAGREDGVLPKGTQEVDLDPRMDERLERAEREALLWRHFDALGEGCREVLRRFFAGESMRHIAAQLDTSEGYVKKRKHVCKERLVAAVRADARYAELLP